MREGERGERGREEGEREGGNKGEKEVDVSVCGVGGNGVLEYLVTESMGKCRAL